MEEISWKRIQEFRNINIEDKKRIEETTEYRKTNQDYKNNFLLNAPMQEILKDILNDQFVRGCLVRYPHGVVVSYGTCRSFFRGENKIYDKCYSSLGRIIASDRSKKELEKFKSFLKVIKLGDEIVKLNQVWDWPSNMGDVFFDAIAQHYSLPTNIIDITDDIDVALFFACCIYDRNTNRYRPLNEEDIEKNPNGVLYIRNDNYLLPLELDVLPIGYQPFTRCYKQRGYFIKDTLEEDFELEKNRFRKYFFKHDISFSQEIFDKFHGGEDIFDYKNYEIIDNLVKRIEALKTFSQEVFDCSYEDYLRNGGIFSKEILIEELKKENIFINNETKPLLTKEEIDKLNENWNLEKIIDEERIYPSYRKIYLG